MIVEITRRVEFDAGHRIPDHKSKCRNFHGHRYVLEATLRGMIVQTRGTSDEGMVTDFGDLKAIMNEAVADVWDHGFLVSADDSAALGALALLHEGHKTVIVSFVPTVENLAREAFYKIHELLERTKQGPQPHSLHRVRLYETPNCWADFPSLT